MALAERSAWPLRARRQSFFENIIFAFRRRRDGFEGICFGFQRGIVERLKFGSNALMRSMRAAYLRSLRSLTEPNKAARQSRKTEHETPKKSRFPAWQPRYQPHPCADVSAHAAHVNCR